MTLSYLFNFYRPMTEISTITAERNSNSIIEQQLDERISSLEKVADADVMSYVGPIQGEAVGIIKDAIEAKHKKRKKLFILLETPGGYIHAAERIARIIRHHYEGIEFIVPNYAMSAGTVLVMAGDAIYMDYSSILGPIDPQVPQGNRLVPALGYLEQYNRLIDKSREETLTTAELAYLLNNFDAAELYQYEQEREMSIALLEEWLVKYKFKDWTITESRGKKVTERMRKMRAREIAKKLNKTDFWHSHSRGIPIDRVRQDLNLQVNDFGEDEKLGKPIYEYYHLLQDYMMRRGHEILVLHIKGSYVGAK